MLLYQQIKQYITALIGNKERDVKLPSERQLLEQFNSSRITVREALFRLETEGLIYRQNRKGWFVSPARLRWNPIKKANYYQLAEEQGFIPQTRLLRIQDTVAPKVVCRAFEQDATDACWEVFRVRSLDGRPVMLEEIFCQKQAFPNLHQKALEGSITVLFSQEYNITISSEQSSITVTALPDDKAELLSLNAGAPCLKIIRQRFCQQNKLIDYNIEYWVHGAIEIEVKSH